MNKLIILTVLLVFVFSEGAGTGRRALFYAGTFTSEGAEGIYLCALDTGAGKMELLRVFKGVDNPNFLRKSPGSEYLYVVGRGPGEVDPEGGFVAAYRILEEGSLQFLGKQSSGGADPCYVDVSHDGKYVAVANYGGGSVALFAAGERGVLTPALSVVRHVGSGPLLNRQSKPYAHSIRFSGKERLLTAADLGADRLFFYRIGERDELVPAAVSQVALPPGSGPRHFEWSADLTCCYVANELNSTVTVFRKEADSLRCMGTLSTLPENYNQPSFCADIHLSPCNRWVYVSNRGHNSIAVFRREPGGTLWLVTHVPTGGNWPRNFTFDPSGRFMLVANQRSHSVTLFRLVDGIPVPAGETLDIPAPVCIEFL